MSVIHLNPEDGAARALMLRRRAERRARLEAAAQKAVAAAVEAQEGPDRALMAVLLLERAAAAVAALYDAPRAQAILGATASRFGGELPAARAGVRAAAERAFRGRR